MSGYLLDRRVELGLTQNDIAKAVGVSAATVSRWEGGQIANMKRDKIAMYAKILQVSPSFIMTGENRPGGDATPKGFDPLPEMVQVPLIGSIACGSPVLAEENIEAYIGVPAIWKADFALTCHGDSMAPTIQDGDIVCIRSTPEVEQGKIAAVRIGEEATLKHFYLNNDSVILTADNNSYPPMTFSGQALGDVAVEGLAVGLCRGLDG